MTKSNKAVMVTVRMTELQVSELDYIRQPGETRSAAIRRLLFAPSSTKPGRSTRRPNAERSSK